MRLAVVLVLALALARATALGMSNARPPTPALGAAIDDRELVDPSEFFAGSKPRPRLEITSPENGEVLDRDQVAALPGTWCALSLLSWYLKGCACHRFYTVSPQVFIGIKVHGYEFPSSLRDAKVCLGLAAHGARVIEECFDQSIEATRFHAGNLAPGVAYMLRVVLFERDHALAVSVRGFRVGAVALPMPDGYAAYGHRLPPPGGAPRTGPAALAGPSDIGGGGEEGGGASITALTGSAAAGDAVDAHAGPPPRTVTIQTALQVVDAAEGKFTGLQCVRWLDCVGISV